MNKAMRKEPAITISVIGMLVGAVATALVQFGIPVTDGQADAITGLLWAVYTIVTPILIRANVFSPDTAEFLGGQAEGDAQE